MCTQKGYTDPIDFQLGKKDKVYELVERHDFKSD